MSEVTARQALSNAVSYWEPRRLLYNAALAVVVGAVYVLNLPASRADVNFSTAEVLFALAVLANVAYCAAYVVDVVAQLSSYRAIWLRVRWGMLTVGILFGAVLADFFSSGAFAHPS